MGAMIKLITSEELLDQLLPALRPFASVQPMPTGSRTGMVELCDSLEIPSLFVSSWVVDRRQDVVSEGHDIWRIKPYRARMIPNPRWIFEKDRYLLERKKFSVLRDRLECSSSLLPMMFHCLDLGERPRQQALYDTFYDVFFNPESN
jgi:hypothetical protein